MFFSALPIDLPCVDELNRTDMEGKTEVGLKKVEKEIDEGKAEIKKLEDKLEGTSDPRERTELNIRLTAKEQRLTSLEQRLTSLQEEKIILMRREGRKSTGALVRPQDPLILCVAEVLR